MKFTIDIDVEKIAKVIREIASDATLETLNHLSDEKVIELALNQTHWLETFEINLAVCFPRNPKELKPSRLV